jgi:twitching motility protein PilT
MVAAFEVLVATHAIRNLVREGRSRQIRNVVATGQADGMQTLEMALNALVGGGDVHYNMAIAASLHPNEIKKPVSDAGPPAHVKGKRKPVSQG